RMIRYYSGCTGLKTGSTSKAGYCISSTAERDGMELIAVILGSSTRENRNRSSAKLLDFGFANYAYVSFDTEILDPLKVSYGTSEYASVGYKSFGTVCSKSEAKNATRVVELPEKLEAPLRKGDVIGKVRYMSGDTELGCEDIYVLEDVEKITLPQIFARILRKYFFI
ncbi:MAG: D-alanyl-D-alanine carboxypeptidase, partial [Clostridia bacterium]|nr:D-alanyl-D-alanine carboxypeptidase [Clostridia bacterium]